MAKADGAPEGTRPWSSRQEPTSTAGIGWAVSTQRQGTDQYTHQTQALACLYPLGSPFLGDVSWLLGLGKDAQPSNGSLACP